NARLFARVTSSLEAISAMKNLQDNIFASITSGVITTDTEENITLINRSAGQILEIDDTLIGANLKTALPALGPRFDLMVEQVTNEDQRLTGVEFDAQVQRRGHINLSMNLSPIKDAEE